MPKPKSITELLEASQKNYAALLHLVNSYSDEEVQAEFSEGTMNRNIRDILAHLHHWHLMLLGWYKVGMSGEKPEMPAKGYTWKAYHGLNKEIWESYQNVPLETVKASLDESYAKVQALIVQHTDEALFEKKRYKWTGTTSLAVYIIANTSSHYNWAIKLIKKSMK